MRIHLRVHVSYDPEADSAWLEARVVETDHLTAAGFSPRVIHEDVRELLWEDGKEVSIGCSASKAIARFSERCYSERFHF